MNNPNSRRHFLRAAAGLAAAAGSGVPRFSATLATSLAGLGALAAQSSQAADTSGPYKALVCLFMNGGNDSHNRRNCYTHVAYPMIDILSPDRYQDTRYLAGGCLLASLRAPPLDDATI